MSSDNYLTSEPLSVPNHAQVFVLRLHQIQEHFGLTDSQLAEKLQIPDPEFEQLLAGQEVSNNLLLQVMDQVKTGFVWITTGLFILIYSPCQILVRNFTTYFMPVISNAFEIMPSVTASEKKFTH